MTIAATGTSIWLEKAHSLAPLIAQYRDESEKQRHLAEPVYEAMREMGLFKLWLQKSLGGEELDIRTILQVVEQIATFDGAAAWNLCIGLQGGILLGFLAPDISAEMMRDNPNATLGGSGQPGGLATPVEGGYRVTGRWPFLSGCHHTSWLGGNTLIKGENGEVRLNAEGTPDLNMMFFSKDQYEILDTWHTTGLRATGSHDIQVTDAFVPEQRKIPTALTKSPHQPSALYQTRLNLLLGPPLAAVGLGIAAEAINAFADLAINKTPSRGSKKLIDNDSIQMTLGKAMAKLNSGRGYLYESMCERLWPAMQEGNGDSEEIAVDVFLSAVNAAQSAAEAVDLLQTAAGTSGIYEGQTIERCFRDVHMVTQHTGAAPSNYVRAGAYRLGLGYTMGR